MNCALPLIICLCVASLASAQPRLRKDLQAKAQSLVCARRHDTQALWQAGIYDTLLTARTQRSTAPAAQLARTHAVREGNAGYAYGNCAEGRSWLLTVSAPYAPQHNGNTVQLHAGLQHYCRALQAMYAASGWHSPQRLVIRGQSLALPQQGTGVVAVRCLSLQPQRTGPRLLYIFPRGQPTLSAPRLPRPRARGQGQQTTHAWVNAVRQKMQLAALRANTTAPTTRFSVIHDRTELFALKNTLHQKRRRMLGENRARAHSLPAALTMLWVSPFHRQLLLHKEATDLALNITYRHQQVLVTMIFSAAF